MSIQTLTQRYQIAYPISKTIAPLDGGHIDFRSYCNDVSEFDTFFQALGQEVRQEGLVTYEINTGKFKICKKSGSSWTWEQIPTMKETLAAIAEEVSKIEVSGGSGSSGADGKSAYDIWLEQGNSGSKQDFLRSLIGAKGDKGDPGVTPSITIGTVTTVPSTSDASVTMASGSTATNKILNFSIPRGADGASGARTYTKHVIVCVAGQSNAVGYDESPVDLKFAYRNFDPNRIVQLSTKPATNLQLVPLTSCAENWQRMDEINARSGTNVGSDAKVGNFAVHAPTTKVYGTRGIHLPLANLLLNEIPDDYGIIIIPNAYGGTGFNSGDTGTYNSETKSPSNGALKWGKTSPYYLAMVDRIKYALDLHEDNLFLGVIWIQGENDNGNAATHKTAWTQMVEDFFSKMNADNRYKLKCKKGVWDKDLWFNVESTYHWFNQPECQKIWDNYKAWNKNTYVEIPRDTPINLTLQTSGTAAAHFGQGAFHKIIAPRVVKKMKEAGALFTYRIPDVCDFVEKVVKEYVAAKAEQFKFAPNPSSITLSLNGTTLTSSANPNWAANGAGSANIWLTEEDATEFEFVATRNLYWVLIAGNEGTDAFALGVLGGSTNFGKVSAVGVINQIGVGTGGDSTIHASGRYLTAGDVVRLVRDDSAKTVKLYTKKSSESDFVHVLTYNLSQLPNPSSPGRFGFTCGISPSSEANSGFGGMTAIAKDIKYAI